MSCGTWPSPARLRVSGAMTTRFARVILPISMGSNRLAMLITPDSKELSSSGVQCPNRAASFRGVRTRTDALDDLAARTPVAGQPLGQLGPGGAVLALEHAGQRGLDRRDVPALDDEQVLAEEDALGPDASL